MLQIKFGTDGWRAIIADEFTLENVKRVAEATALWLKKQSDSPQVVIGHDCRFGGKMFSDASACVMAAMGIKVYLASNQFVSTPMISLGAVKLKTNAGVIITASHNPPSYNGYKLKAHYGGPSSPEDIEAVEQLIPETCTVQTSKLSQYIADGNIEYVDLEQMYVDEVVSSFDLDAIKKSGIKMAYDAMYGAGQNVMKRILPDTHFLHADYNPSFMGQAPEPIMKNLSQLSAVLKAHNDLKLGLATDGDADRIGLMDAQGNFVDSHHILLMLIHYLHKYKHLNGKIVVSFSCTGKLKKLAQMYNLPIEITKIGFKYICGKMVEEDVLVGGEESGGIAIKGYIPERDGIWIGLTILEFMAKTGKSLEEITTDIYALVGSFANERYDLHIEEHQKQSIVANCKSGAYTSFGSYKVQGLDDLDGFKFNLGNEETVMIRASGTEPVLRVYAESETYQGTINILEAVKKEILS